MGELFAHSRMGDVPMKRVELTTKELEKSAVREGDLLFARRSLVAEGAGKCSIVKAVTGQGQRRMLRTVTTSTIFFPPRKAGNLWEQFFAKLPYLA
jgi:hypothetical protein